MIIKHQLIVKYRLILILAAVLAIFSGVVQQALSWRMGAMEDLALVRTVPGGGELVAQIFDDGMLFSLADSAGQVSKRMWMPAKRDGLTLEIADAAVDADGLLYLLEDLSDPETGEWRRQELELYDLRSLNIRRIQRHKPEETMKPEAAQSEASGTVSAASPRRDAGANLMSIGWNVAGEGSAGAAQAESEESSGTSPSEQSETSSVPAITEPVESSSAPAITEPVESSSAPAITEPVESSSVPAITEPKEISSAPAASEPADSASSAQPVTGIAAQGQEQEAGVTRYRWISAGSSVILMGTSADEKELIRDAFDPATLRQRGGMVSKMTRRYPLDPAEGIYQALPQGTGVVYSSRSGKIFLTTEDTQTPRELYPARELESLMYPLYLSASDSTSIIVGEQESGDILRLDTDTGETSSLKRGTEPFSGVSSYAPVDLLTMSMQDIQSYTGVVQNKKTLDFELVVSEKGTLTVVPRLTPSPLLRIISCGRVIFFTLLAAFAILMALFWLFRQLRQSRTIMAKLAFSTIPVLVLVLVLFGGFSYLSYSQSIHQSFEKQVVDEGNLLTALFGTESFGEIEFPYDFTGEAYGYLSNQMKTRQVFTRTAYYERNAYFTGVDSHLPPFYPFGITLSRASADLYRQAALSGKTATGVISDRYGKRMSCVTPIGGVSGGTVYLLETGIYMDNVTNYTKAYLQNYVLAALAFIIGVSAILLLSFKGILRPLDTIKKGMEAFSKGNRELRLESETGDEFSDITRVFNKMADDIDAQIFNLKGVSDNYFRFIPPRIFHLLGKENLAELELGNSVEGRYCVLTATLRADTGDGDGRERVDHFFGVVNGAANAQGGTLVTDSVNLHRLRVITENGEAGVRVAISALAQLGGSPDTPEALFVLHRAQICYRISGDQDRYVPAMLSQEMQWLDGQDAFLQQLSCRLVVTEAARETLDQEKYSSRFIGKLVHQGGFVGIYEFYDANPPEQTRLITSSRIMFDKAMQLFSEDRYYDAKNLFAMVLRENPADNAARHYLFICEQRL